MKRLLLMFTVAAVFAAMMMVSAVSGFASPASDACAAQGGQYVQNGSQKQCVLPPQPSNPGNPQSGQAAQPFTTNTTTTQTGAGGGGGEKHSSSSTTTNPAGHPV